MRVNDLDDPDDHHYPKQAPSIEISEQTKFVPIEQGGAE
jgi:hypothetical protein